jgi:CRP-like cAMP-binding protein
MYKRLRDFLEQFSSLSDQDFSRLESLLIIRELKKKEFLTATGEVEDYIYFILEGLIHQYFFKGKEMVTTDIIPEGTMTNSAVSFLSRKPSHYSLQALEPTKLLGLSKNNLELLYREDRKWQKLLRILITYFLIRQEKHMIDNIRLSMRERFLQFNQDYPSLLHRVPQRRLASLLNIKPETFTRLKPLLKNGG